MRRTTPANQAQSSLRISMTAVALLAALVATAAHAEDFARQVDQLHEIQEQSADGGPIRRGVHAKPHGCLAGELQVLSDRPATTRVGLFRDTATYPVWTRFSNGSPHQRPDSLLDARGLAIKVLGTERLTSDVPAQDFVLINMAQAPGSSPEEFMDFMMASSRGNLAVSWFLAGHPRVAAVWARAALHQVDSVVTESYWSVTPFALGPRAVKFAVTPSYEAPCAPISVSRPWFPGANYLADDLRRQAAAHPLCFDLSVQMQAQDPAKTPIEDPMVLWQTPLHRVARLVLPAQTFDSPEQVENCERLEFTPWHYLPEHAPLGRMNASRKPVYDQSQEYRR